MKLHIKKLYPDALAPLYASAGAACFDLHAYVAPPETPASRMSGVQTSPGEPVTLGTGLAFEVPAGFVMLVFSRSGHGFKHDVRLANCVGVIDSDYRGEVMVKLTQDPNWAGKPLTIHHGERIAQAMLVPVQQVEFVPVENLTWTERGDAGLGSTGTGVIEAQRAVAPVNSTNG